MITITIGRNIMEDLYNYMIWGNYNKRIEELALVLSKMPGGYYQGHTCLTMEMAYNNARLIARPESNWLLP